MSPAASRRWNIRAAWCGLRWRWKVATRLRALVPDATFYGAPVQPGDAATLVWSEQDVHLLAQA